MSVAFHVVVASRLPRLPNLSPPVEQPSPPPAPPVHIRAGEAAARAAEVIAEIDRTLATIGPRTVECRSSAIDTLDVDQNTRIIRLIAVPYEESTSVVLHGQMWSEVFTAGAFGGVERRANPIRVNRGHDKTRTVGRVISFDAGNPRGRIAEIRIAKTQLGDETLTLAAEDCLSASVAFSIPAGGAQHDHQRRHRRVNRAELDHVSLVESPAYAGAGILRVG